MHTYTYAPKIDVRIIASAISNGYRSENFLRARGSARALSFRLRRSGDL